MGEARGCLSSAERGVEGLIAAVKAGDNHAGEALVTAMTPLVAGLARRFEGRVSRSDLEQAGMVGVLQAAHSFDPAQGTPFGGYATPFVVGEMLACVRQLATPVKVPRSLAETQRTVAVAIEELTAAHGRSPTVREIGECTGLDHDTVLEALRLRLAATGVPLDEVDERRLGSADEALARVENRLDRLDARSRRVIVMRFGLELSQREIAARLGVSQMHVSRLIRAGLAELASDDPPP